MDLETEWSPTKPTAVTSFLVEKFRHRRTFCKQSSSAESRPTLYLFLLASTIGKLHLRTGPGWLAPRRLRFGLVFNMHRSSALKMGLLSTFNFLSLANVAFERGASHTGGAHDGGWGGTGLCGGRLTGRSTKVA